MPPYRRAVLHLEGDAEPFTRNILENGGRKSSNARRGIPNNCQGIRIRDDTQLKVEVKLDVSLAQKDLLR